MTKTDDFLQWCETHKVSLLKLTVLQLAHEVVYELQRENFLLTEEAETAWTSTVTLTGQLENARRENKALRAVVDRLNGCSAPVVINEEELG